MKELIASLMALFKKDKAPTEDELSEILNKAAETGVALKDIEIEQLKDALKNRSKSKNDDTDNTEVQELKQSNLALTKQVADLKEILTEMKKDRDAGVEAQKEQMKKDHEKKKEEAVAAALKEGKVVESTKELAEKLFDKDPELFADWVKSATVHPEFKKDDTKDNGGDKTKTDTNNSSRGAFAGAPKGVVDAMSKMELN